MKNLQKIGLTLIALTIVTMACNQTKSPTKDMSNPFFNEYKTPFQVPPFNDIEMEHFIPAIETGITEQIDEIKAITENKEEPTFENTILAFDQSGHSFGTKPESFRTLIRQILTTKCRL